jgi:hypothetical protein
MLYLGNIEVFYWFIHCIHLSLVYISMMLVSSHFHYRWFFTFLFLFFMFRWSCVFWCLCTYLMVWSSCRFVVQLYVSIMLSPLTFVFHCCRSSIVCCILLWVAVFLTVFHIELLYCCVSCSADGRYYVLFVWCVHYRCWLVSVCILVQAKLVDVQSFLLWGPSTASNMAFGLTVFLSLIWLLFLVSLNM